MNIAELLPTAHIMLDVDASCAKQAFCRVADKIALDGDLTSREVLDALIERERLGTTGVGDGISIPHARMKALNKVIGVFLRMTNAIDMDAVDDKPVRLMFVLLAPLNADTDHLKVLSRIARILRSPENKQMLIESETPEEVLKILTSEDH